MAAPLDKRKKIMLACLLLLALLVVLDSQSSKQSASNNNSAGFIDTLNGNDITLATKRYNQSLTRYNLSLQDQHNLKSLQEELFKEKFFYWTYTGKTSPRSLIQQEIGSLIRSEGLNEVRVSVGREQSVPNADYLKFIDFPVTGIIKTNQVAELSNFIQNLEKQKKAYNWINCKITAYPARKNETIGSLRFNATIRTYILDEQAIALIEAQL